MIAREMEGVEGRRGEMLAKEVGGERRKVEGGEVGMGYVGEERESEMRRERNKGKRETHRLLWVSGVWVSSLLPCTFWTRRSCLLTAQGGRRR